ncbi:MAG: Mrp/NBP35 family ATP-binding protein [Candidatus Hodarchaeales archaeon]
MQSNIQAQQKDMISKAMERVKRKIVVLSGKGGVGKSTVATNLALVLGKKYPGKIGIVDLDFSGPNVAQMLGVEGQKVIANDDGAPIPVEGPFGVKIVSMAFFIESKSTPVVWRGPIKMKAMQQFLTDFDWGPLEYLIFDMPPGTGDEAISIMQLLPGLDGVVIVTTPQEVSTLDTGKSLEMSRKMNQKVIGIIENMSSFICPSCGNEHTLFGKGGGQQMAHDFGVKLLGQIPFDPSIREKEDIGLTEPFNYFSQIVDQIEMIVNGN